MSFSIRGGLLYVHYACVTARDSIGHVKKCLFGYFRSNVHAGSVGRAAVFHARGVGSNFALVTFFLVFFSFFLIITCNLLKVVVFESRPGHFFSVFFHLSDNSKQV